MIGMRVVQSNLQCARPFFFQHWIFFLQKNEARLQNQANYKGHTVVEVEEDRLNNRLFEKYYHSGENPEFIVKYMAKVRSISVQDI